MEVCLICTDEGDLTAPLFKTPCCQHPMHLDCLFLWRIRNPNCPSCRKSTARSIIASDTTRDDWAGRLKDLLNQGHPVMGSATSASGRSTPPDSPAFTSRTSVATHRPVLVRLAGSTQADVDFSLYGRGFQNRPVWLQLGRCPWNDCRVVCFDLDDLEDHLRTTNSHPVYVCCCRVFTSRDEMLAHQETEDHDNYQASHPLPPTSPRQPPASQQRPLSVFQGSSRFIPHQNPSQPQPQQHQQQQRWQQQHNQNQQQQQPSQLQQKPSKNNNNANNNQSRPQSNLSTGSNSNPNSRHYSNSGHVEFIGGSSLRVIRPNEDFIGGSSFQIQPSRSNNQSTSNNNSNNNKRQPSTAAPHSAPPELCVSVFEVHHPHEQLPLESQPQSTVNLDVYDGRPDYMRPGWLDELRCLYCNRQFHTQRSLQQHMREVKVHEVITCCGKVFFDLAALRKHRSMSLCDNRQVMFL